jgi:hypothetical protein
MKDDIRISLEQQSRNQIYVRHRSTLIHTDKKTWDEISVLQRSSVPEDRKSSQPVMIMSDSSEDHFYPQLLFIRSFSS